MSSTIPTTGGDLDCLLEALDVVDTAVRDLYSKLADDPDLAPEHETVLRELHVKRSELSRQVGMAALVQWRATRSAVETMKDGARPTTEPSTPEPMVLHETKDVLPPTVSEPKPPTQSVAADPLAAVPVVVPSPPASGPIPAAPTSDAQVTALRSAAHPGPTVTPSPPVQRPWPVTLHELMCLLGPRETDLDDAVALAEELDALDEVATRERQASWVRLPIEVQKRWLSHLLARTRAMRDHPSSERVLGRLKVIRAVYPAWAREFVPGHVNGLQLKHDPVRATWADDADDHWRALVAIVGNEIPTARKNPPTRKKKERPPVEEEPEVVEPDWPLLFLMRGKTAVIVGGAPKEPNRDRLETYLRLATLEWPDIEGPRKVEAISQRIAKGAYDVVIVVQTMISHPEAERILGAAKQGRVPWAMAEGFGVTAVRQGLERFLWLPRDVARR